MIFSILLLATSCCKPSVRTVTEYQIIKPPETLLKPCPEVPLDMKTNGDMVMALIELNTQYFLCSMKVQSIILFYEDEKMVEGQ